MSAAGVSVLVAGLTIPLQSATTWGVGDVFVAIGGGSYKVYSNTGTFKETITTSSDLTAGCAFNSQFDLYTTNSTNTKVFKFDGDIPHSLLQTVDTNANSAAGHSESIVFDASGNFYVGHQDGNRDVLKYNSAGAFQDNFDVPFELRGSDWIDLAVDQKTLYYTSEGTRVLRYDVAADVSLDDAPVAAGALTKAFALRLLSPFDGTGGLIVANNANIKRLSGSPSGAVVRTYDASGQNDWQTLALDPDGVHFWAGDWKTGKLYKFNLGSSSPVLGPISTGANKSLGGICVMGQQQLNIIPLVFEPGTNVQRVAEFGNSSSTAFHTWAATINQVNTKFILALSSTEGLVDPSRLDPVFPFASPIPYADPVHGDSLPGNPVVYRAFNPPPASAITGSILIYVAFHQPPLSDYTPPGGITGTAGNARLLRDPSDVNTTGHEHDFIYDSTTFVNKFGKFGDPIGGTTLKFNDYVVADRPTTEIGGTASFSQPHPNDSVNQGSAVPVRLDVANAGGPVNNANDFPNDVTLSITNAQGDLVKQFFILGSSSFFADKGNGQYGANLDTTGLATGIHSLCATSVFESGSEIGTGTGAGQFPPVCVQINIQ